MILYFDTETTGLCPGRIVQLSYIMDYGEKVIGKNFYFAVEYVEPGAVAVHGYTPEKLYKLSNGKTFSDYADEIYDDFFEAEKLVAHNFKFDLSFMIAEFSYLDRQFRYHESFDTMKFFTPIMKLKQKTSNAYKYPKLTELMEFCDIYPYDVSRSVRSVFNDDSMDSHEARFDTASMFLCVKSKICENQELCYMLTPKEALA